MASGEYENDRDALIREVKQKASKRERAGSGLAEAVAGDYGAPEAEATISVGNPPVTLEIRQKLNGEFLDRMDSIQDQVGRFEDSPGGERPRPSDTAEKVAGIMADMTVDSNLTKSDFYNVYKLEGLEALGRYLEAAGEAIGEELEEKRGDADGFRKQ